MSDVEANAQSSEMAEGSFLQGTVSGMDGVVQDGPGAVVVSDIDVYRRLVGAMASGGGESAEGDVASGGFPEEDGEGADAGAGSGGAGAEERGEGDGQDDSGQSRRPAQYRFRPENEVEALAFDIRKRSVKSGRSVSMKEALAQAESILKMDAGSTAAAAGGYADGSHQDGGGYGHDDDNGNAAATGLPPTVDEAAALLNQLRGQRRTALTRDLDFDAVAEIDEKIDFLKDHIRELKESGDSEGVSRQQQEAQWTQTLDASRALTVELYPDTTSADSALVRRMVEIDTMLKESGNDLFFAPDKPLKLAQMAANELGIAPRRSSFSSSSSSSSSDSASSQQQLYSASQPYRYSGRPVQPASAPMSGAARTTQGGGTHRQIAAELDKIMDEEGWRAAMDKFKGV